MFRLHSFLMTLLVLTIALTAHLSSFAQTTPTLESEQDPAQTAELWLTAYFNSDGSNIARYTCRSVQNDLQESQSILTIINSFRSIGRGGATLGVDVQFDLRDLQFTLVSQDTEKASVQVTGPFTAAVGDTFEVQNVNIILPLIYEVTRWKVCDPTNGTSSSVGDGVVPIELYPIEINQSEPKDGWITYQTRFGVVNRGSDTIYVRFDDLGEVEGGFHPPLQIVDIETADAIVKTVEEISYPAAVGFTHGRNDAPLLWAPPNLLSASDGHQYLVARYRVPEQLHPTVLVLHSDGSRIEMDLSRHFSRQEFDEQLPTTLEISSNISATISNTRILYVSAESRQQYEWTQGLEFVGMSVELKNSDDSDDAAVEMALFLMDSQGTMLTSSGSSGPTELTNCSGLPELVGTGQIFILQVCFQIPQTEIASLTLVLVGNEFYHAYSLNGEHMLTCNPEYDTQGVRLPDLNGRTIRIAVENGFPPFNSINSETGEAEGWDYDTFREICIRLNCIPEFIQTSWDGMLVAIANGEFDVAADGIIITDERERSVDFSIGYYMTTDQSVLGFAFPPGSDLVGFVNFALMQMMEDCTLAEFNTRWITPFD